MEMSEVDYLDEKVICKQCGYEFILTEEEATKFVAKGLELPKRCFRCRKKNKQRQEIREMIIEELDKRFK